MGATDAGRVEGKVAMISGAARGLGLACATLLAREGAHVVITDVLDEDGNAAAEGLVADGLSVTYAHLDVTSESNWAAAVDLAVATYGGLDVLVNNAGIPLRKNLEQTTLDDWNLVMAINVTGPFLGTRTSVPALRQRGGGSIVNISSVSGIVASSGTAYGTSKGAVRSLTKSTALLYAPENIRCNSVHPGPLDTEVNREAQLDQQRWAKRMEAVPLGRIGQPIDIAYGVLYLASDESSYVTGSELVIDGGSIAI